MRPMLALAFGWLSITVAGLAWADEGPNFSPTGPDATAYGIELGFPTAPRGMRPSQHQMVGSFSRFDSIYPHRVVTRPPTPSPLRRATETFDVTYNYQGGTYRLEDYLERSPTTGLLIAQGDTTLFEAYRYGRTDRDRFLSQSMAKTITGLLVGLAVADGKIRSIDQTAADYVPELAGTGYGQTSIRDLLHMASGIAFLETYDGKDDVAKLSRGLFGADNPGAARVLAQFSNRDVPPGTRFHYAGAETETLGLVVTAAVGMPLSRYVESRIWQPLGAEADASWTIDARGQEIAYCCFNAILRDWARLGLMLAHDGQWNNRQIIPRDWVLDGTTVAAPFLAPGRATPGMGYGYQVWLLGGPRRQFSLRGIHGQSVNVDPAARLVMVHTAVRPKAAADPGLAEHAALWRAVVAARSGK